MSVLKSMIIAFSMYSKIPMPRTEWNKEDMKYVLCWFPWVGAVIGGAFLLLWEMWNLLSLSDLLFAGIATALPILITGGIHLDGFLDTVDARSSYGDREKKLGILKDPHVGAFAVIYGSLYILLYFTLAYELRETGEIRQAVLFAVTPILSRILSGSSLLWLPSAKKEGLASTFAAAADLRKNRVVMGILLAVISGLLLLVHPFRGAVILVLCAAIFYCYRRMAVREFGGITGDLAGFFLQICELTCLAVSAI